MDYSKFIREADLKQIETNWIEQQPLKGTAKERDYMPVVKIFNPIGAATLLITEKDPESGLAFGIADLGFGCPEMGYIDLEEVLSVQLLHGLKMEQDLFFIAKMTLSQYAERARKEQSLRA